MEFERRLTTKVANDGTLLSPGVTSLGLRLSVLQLEWCRRVCAGQLLPGARSAAPATVGAGGPTPSDGHGSVLFPEVPPDAARLLPEDVLTSSLEYIAFVGQHRLQTFSDVGADVVEALLLGTVAFLRNPGYVRSPHLRASFGTVRAVQAGPL
jgi:hypothetical protein